MNLIEIKLRRGRKERCPMVNKNVETKKEETRKNAGKPCKYIFVTGGVLSGVGKGITAASVNAM